MTNKLKIRLANITGLTLLIEYNGILYPSFNDYIRARCGGASNGACTEKEARDELYNICTELAKKLTEETKLGVLTYLMWTSMTTSLGKPEKSNYYDNSLDLILDDLFNQAQEEVSHD